ncbi:MAG: serine/threonine protein phosphatase [bacterium]|nr:serine/threonine protein phosphatase [bacterium]
MSAAADAKRFVIGDIHGCAAHLRILLALLEKKLADPARDRVIFLGDYIDRGPDSRGVVDLLLDFATRFDAVFLKGNHDAQFVPWRNRTGHLRVGGFYTKESYKVDGKIEVPDSHMRFFEELKLYHEEDDFLCVHAGLHPDKGWVEKQSEADMLNIREKFFHSDIKWKKLVIFGHSPGINAYSTVMPFNMVRPHNTLGIDTGAVFDGRLSCYEVRGRNFHQVYREKGRWKIANFALDQLR